MKLIVLATTAVDISFLLNTKLAGSIRIYERFLNSAMCRANNFNK